MVLSVNVSPPGGHSVRIVTSTAGEDTVHYNVTDIKTNCEIHTFLRKTTKASMQHRATLVL